MCRLVPLIYLRIFARFFRRLALPDKDFRLAPASPETSAVTSGRQSSSGWRLSVMETRGPPQAETQCFATEPDLPPSSNKDHRGNKTARPIVGSQQQARTFLNEAPTNMGSSPSKDRVRMGRA